MLLIESLPQKSLPRFLNGFASGETEVIGVLTMPGGTD
jgi:hypothetical protein